MTFLKSLRDLDALDLYAVVALTLFLGTLMVGLPILHKVLSWV